MRSFGWLRMKFINSRGSHMKRLVLAATAIVSAASLTATARAADIAPAAYDWSGFYVGLNAGAAWNNSEVENSLTYEGPGFGGPFTPDAINDFVDDLDSDLDGDQTAFTGGALIGYNWQHDALVLGVEADINYVNFSDESSVDRINVAQPFYDDINTSSDLSFDANWFGTLRGRIGFAADNLLFYGTGGLAYGHMEASADVEITNGDGGSASYSASTDSTNWGWTVGGGMEVGIDNWSLGVEYLYVDLGDGEWDGDVNGVLGDEDVQEALADITGNGSVDYQFSVVRATAKIRF
jgi:outer membrane immunogenic protein